MCFSFLLVFAVVISSIFCVFVDVANFFDWSFPFSTLCRAGFVTSYWLNLDLS